MDFLALKNFAHRTEHVYSEKRFALTGEAGLFIDPFYSPGSDLIAMSNTFITDLISRDLRGESIKQHATIYDQMYRSFAENTFLVYQDQYPLFGNPQVMNAKLHWDFAVYWIFLAALYCHGQLCDLSFFVRIKATLDELRDLNASAQGFFREWHESGVVVSKPEYINLRDSADLFRLNLRLQEERSSEQLEQDLKEGMDLLRSLLADFQKQSLEQMKSKTAA